MIIRMEVSNVGLSTMRVTCSALFVGIPVQYNYYFNIKENFIFQFAMDAFKAGHSATLHDLRVPEKNAELQKQLSSSLSSVSCRKER